jgi:hypothetical protein
VDQFGRLLRYIYVDDIFVNYELVRRGYADATAYPPDTSCQVLFNSARTQAQSDGVGIWQATPTVPVGSSQALIEIIAVNKEEEYVDIQNIGNQTQNLSGWYLVSERGNQTCYLSGNIGPGEVLRIWAGSSNSGGFSCGFGTYIWNNSESDPAVLYNAQGTQVSRYP